MSESLILVDARNRRIGTADKQTVHEHGLLHRAFSIFLVDESGGVLLQRRHDAKYHSGGLWSNTCCGHPRPGEHTRVAAERRLAEELGASSPLKFEFQARYSAMFANGLKENEIVSVYFGRVPRTIAPNPTEISAVYACSLPELRERVRSHPGDYSVWLQYYVIRHFDELRAGVQAVCSARARRHQAGLAAAAGT